ncbi:hypothetical protein LZD57_13395 [Jiella sp. CBK1P-4]|uniref:DUF5615 domain-containing protein n=1 Tax=Jiella avicenniae TaxID=2907202 RepID=A0A9X1P1V8_9HYPH|nr:hypothetical protein [Jiella avicenniae]
MPKQLVAALRSLGIDAHEFPKQFRNFSNGELIAAVEADGFDVLVTNDKNIASQQSLRGKKVAVVALPLNRRRQIVERADDVADTVRRSRPACRDEDGWNTQCQEHR